VSPNRPRRLENAMKTAPPEENTSRVVRAIPVSGGVAVGPAFVFGDIFDEVETREIMPADASGEKARFEEAVRLVKSELEADAERISRELGQDKADVFLVHSMILEDPTILDAIRRRIDDDLLNGEAAVALEMKRLSGVLARSDDEYLRDRSYDISDIGRRVIERMLGVWAHCPLMQPMIIVARELRASDTVTMDRGRILGFITELGGKETHAAILARSLGVPAVVGARGIVDTIRTGDTVVVDGDSGDVILDPPAPVVEDYARKREVAEQATAELEPLIGLPAVTLDGTEIGLLANIGSVEDARAASRLGADGVGLFRTEFVFMAAGTFLSEDDQYKIYREAVEASGGKPITIRTLDIGGDKFVGPNNPLREHNPYLGYRSIRVLLDRPELFSQQMRAILRAGAHGDVRMMWPMIASVEELRAAKAILSDAASGLRAEGAAFRENMPVGVMIEIPSAAVVADRLSAECDFLSIGTNDLVQYTLAVDRGNVYVDHLYRPHAPAVLSLLALAIEGARQTGTPIALCGEMAGETPYVALLVGLGLRELSVSTSRLLPAKSAIRLTNCPAAAELAAAAVSSSTAADVEALLGMPRAVRRAKSARD
jgi:phosphotransferase system enzyme I (PtsI)